MARRLGARPFQLHAPAFTDTPAERQLLTGLRQVDEILQLARRAQIAVMGVGSLMPETSSFFQFASISPGELQAIIQREQGVGEILARVITAEGRLCSPELSARVVGIEVEDLRCIPLTIGVAALEAKVEPIAAALRGRYLKTIITDEVTAQAVLEHFTK
jgi:DNA-binding transcriptional regulator LsrR (DeoR family)